MSPPARALVLQHLAFEHLDGFAPGIRRARLPIETFLAPDALPQKTNADDLLIVLGGPIGAYETQRYPFLIKELALIEAHLAKDGAVLGICLGAQLLAQVLGARVYASGSKEIGIAPINLTEAGRHSCLASFEQSPQTLHWHGDTFELPADSTRLAGTEQCENQAFVLGPRVIGFQFHPEATGAGIEHWLVGHSAELAQAGIDPIAVRRAVADNAQDLTRKADQTITAWLKGLSAFA